MDTTVKEVIKKEIEEIKKVKLEDKIREMADNLENFLCNINKAIVGDKTEYSFRLQGSRTSKSEIVLSGTHSEELPKKLYLTIDGKTLYEVEKNSKNGLGYLYSKAIKLWKEKLILGIATSIETGLLQSTFVKEEKNRNY